MRDPASGNEPTAKARVLPDCMDSCTGHAKTPIGNGHIDETHRAAEEGPQDNGNHGSPEGPEDL